MLKGLGTSGTDMFSDGQFSLKHWIGADASRQDKPNTIFSKSWQNPWRLNTKDQETSMSKPLSDMEPFCCQRLIHLTAYNAAP